jgi:hypothetical protein
VTVPLTGYTSSLPSDVVLDSGVLYIGATVLGALTGGLKFDPGIEYRAIEFDGRRSPVRGLDRKSAVMPKLSGTMIQLSTTNVAQIEPGGATNATGAWTGSTSYTGKRAGSLLVSGDYLTDVRAIWARGSGAFVQVRFPAGLLTKYDMTSQDSAEIAIAIEIEARLPIDASGFTNVGDMPYRIEYLAAV